MTIQEHIRHDMKTQDNTVQYKTRKGNIKHARQDNTIYDTAKQYSTIQYKTRHVNTRQHTTRHD